MFFVWKETQNKKGQLSKTPKTKINLSMKYFPLLSRTLTIISRIYLHITSHHKWP